MKRAAGIAFVFILVTAGTAAGDWARIKSKEAFGCTDRTYQLKLTRYVGQGDNDAFHRELRAAIMNGKCTIWKAGEEIDVMERSRRDSMVRLRRKGETVEYWAPAGAIR